MMSSCVKHRRFISDRKTLRFEQTFADEDTDQLKDYIQRARYAGKVDLDQWSLGCQRFNF